MPKKRRSDEPLDDLAKTHSPLPKRARVGSRNANFNGDGLNGHVDDVPDILGADREEHEEMVEAGAVDLMEEDKLEDDEAPVAFVRQSAPAEGYDDLYLDTIDRVVLDFDFEKLCSVTLSNINVYACLICGKYFQGRGPKSQAFFHALDEGHHVFINMETKLVYVLPEGYEVKSKSLDDIKFVVDPRLPKSEVLKIDKESRSSWDLSGKKYVPGFIGMNNIKANDYLNVIIQLLSHVPPLRNYFMLEDLASRAQLAQRFGILVRKIWNPRAFKAHVSPHELLQEVALRSSKRFTLTEQSDPVEFLNWFLNNLHLALGGSRSKPGTSIVQKVFQGSLQIESQAITARADAGDRLRFEDADVQSEVSRFLLLTLDLPPTPLFQDELDKNIIPQVALTTILSKYDGIRAQERLNFRRRFRLLHPLPPYLLLHIKRFSANKFVSERNPTIVTFPPTGLDMTPYVVPNPALHPPGERIIYDLVANVTHEAVRVRDDSVEGEAEKKVWRCQVVDRASNEWFEMQDLFVEKVSAETLFTKESYVQVWERRKSRGKGKETA
jgi:U4/U6.U5 tri-snRNP-associated protein 2